MVSNDNNNGDGDNETYILVDIRFWLLEVFLSQFYKYIVFSLIIMSFVMLTIEHLSPFLDFSTLLF